MASIASQRGRNVYWLFSFVFVGLVGGIVYNNRGLLVVLVTACIRAARAHVWDAVCLAMAMAAILMGLLGGKTGSCDDENSYEPSCDFHALMHMLGLPDRDFCPHSPPDDDALSASIATTTSAHEASIASTHASSIATTTHTDSLACNHQASIACRHNSFIACTTQPPATACHRQASAIAAGDQQYSSCVSNVVMTCCYQSRTAFYTDTDQASIAGSWQSDESTSSTAGSAHGDVECSDECGRGDMAQLVAYAAGRVCGENYEGEMIKRGYGTQAARCTAGGQYPAGDELEGDEEYSRNVKKECAEISRKADAFIASFREQMRREMMGDMIQLCT